MVRWVGLVVIDFWLVGGGVDLAVGVRRQEHGRGVDHVRIVRRRMHGRGAPFPESYAVSALVVYSSEEVVLASYPKPVDFRSVSTFAWDRNCVALVKAARMVVAFQAVP